MRLFTVIFLLGVAMAFCSGVTAEIYQWKDAEGVTHFSDTKPKDQSAEQKQLYINSGMRFATDEQLLEAMRRKARAEEQEQQAKQAALPAVKVSPQDKEAIAKALEDEEALKKAVKRAAASKVKERRRAIYNAQQNN